MTRPFTCRAIAQPLPRLAIASFHVYGLIDALFSKMYTLTHYLEKIQHLQQLFTLFKFLYRHIDISLQMENTLR